MAKQMTDYEFLRSLAHVVEIGDPVEERDIVRLREIARAIQIREEDSSGN